MHHTRRRSGHGLPNTSMTDVRKAAVMDAANTSSRHKSSSSSKHTSGSNGRRSGGTVAPSSGYKSGRGVERDDDDFLWDEERESFPQYCMTCEKQFIAPDDRIPYCSEECRDYDQAQGASASAQHFMDSYASTGYYPTYATDMAEPRDIIPRASPSRPSSTYFSPPSTPAKLSSALSHANTAAASSSAIAALRSLSIRDGSPPSPNITANIWPFSSRSAAVSPNTPYTRSSSKAFAATYDNGYYRTSASNYYSSDAGNALAATNHAAAERPLPSRRPGSYARPNSIELVTPLIGQ